MKKLILFITILTLLITSPVYAFKTMTSESDATGVPNIIEERSNCASPLPAINKFCRDSDDGKLYKLDFAGTGIEEVGSGGANTDIADWTAHNSYPASCTNQFIRALGDTNTCASIAYTDIDFLDTDGTLSANSDVKVASQKAAKTYVDAHSTAFGGADWVNLVNDYYGANVVTTTTGTIANATNDLTVVGATGWATGMGICIDDAGVAGDGDDLCCAKVTVSGTAFTLLNSDDSDCNASTASCAGGGCSVMHDNAYAFSQAQDSGKNIYIPGGTYNYGGAVVTLDTANQIIQGAGGFATQINIRKAASDIFLITADKVRLRDMYFNQTVTATSGVVIALGDASHAITKPFIDSIYFNGIYKAFLFKKVQLLELRNFEVYAPVSIGIHVDNINPYGDNWIEDGWVALNNPTVVGIQIDSADLQHWVNVKVNGADGTDLDITGANGYVANQEFLSCSFEGGPIASGGYTVKVRNTGISYVFNNLFAGGDMGNMTGDTTSHTLYIGNGVDGTEVNGVSIATSDIGIGSHAIYDAGQHTRIIGVRTDTRGLAGFDMRLYLDSTSSANVMGSYFGNLYVNGTLSGVQLIGNEFPNGITGAGLYNANNTLAHNIGIYNSSLVFRSGADSTTFLQFLDADGGAPILNIDSTNERVGVGTDAPVSTLTVAAISAYPTASIVANATGSTAFATVSVRRNNAASETLTTTVDTQNLGQFSFQGVNAAAGGNAFANGAVLRGLQNGTVNANDTTVPTDFVFLTSPGGSTAATERMRITKLGITSYSPVDAAVTPITPTASLKFFGYNLSLAADADDAFTSGTDGLTLPAVTTSGYLVITTSGGLTLQANVAANGTATVIFDSGAGIEYQAAIASCTELCLYDVGSNANIWNDSAGTLIVNVMFWYN